MLAIEALFFSRGLELAHCLAQSLPGELLMSAYSHRRLSAFAGASAAESASASAWKWVCIMSIRQLQDHMPETSRARPGMLRNQLAMLCLLISHGLGELAYKGS